MNLTHDARIITDDGHDIGHLNHFVIDPRTKTVTHIVLARGLVTKQEYLLPIQLVDHVDDQGIHLRPLPVKNPEELMLFKQDNYVVTNERALLNGGYISDEAVQSYYYYPPSPYATTGTLPISEMYTTPAGTVTGTGQGVPITGNEPVTKEVEENIPEGTVALKEGAKVISSDSQEMGRVDKLFMEPGGTQVTHFLISKGLLLKEHKLIPVDWVSDMDEDKVFLSVDKDFVSRLPDYQEK